MRLWTENVTWFSNEEGKKGRIEAGQLADLIVPDRDFFGCAESEISGITSLLTLVGGRVVWGAGDFAKLAPPAPQAMPDWSPINRFAGFAAWGEQKDVREPAAAKRMASACGCANACTVHGHDHARAWTGKLPVADLKSFWGALGCACWAV